MHRLMPDFILDNYAAGNLSGEFAAAALFVDVSGFSAMTDALMKHGQHGAEVLAGVMRRTFEPLIRSVVEQDGFIAIQAGDAFTALFPLGDDPAGKGLRALAAAWNIQARAAAQLVHRTPYGEFAVSVKVGAALGQVAWGILQSASGSQAAYYFRGDAIDASTQAEHHAQGGQVILARHVYEQFRDQISIGPLGDFVQLAGFNVPLPSPLPVTAREQDVELAERFLPGGISSQRHSGEFRQVIYLFVSMEGVEGEAGIGRFMQRIFDLRAKYGGLLSVHFGDKGAHVLLIWGAPVAHENDLLRALNFVLDLHGQVGGGLRAGMTYRIAHAGFIGSELAEQYAAFGRGANLAARFMEAAPAQSIWVDEYIADHAKRLFELEYVACLDFKGFAVPHEVYALRGRREGREQFFTGSMVGREPELARLADFVRPVFQGRFVGMLTVRGEPGMGKSRLVYEHNQQLAHSAPGFFLECLAQTDEILREGLNPFAYWLRHYFGLTASATESANKDRFTQRLDRLVRETANTALGSELDRTCSCLGALLGLHLTDSLYERLDAQGRYENTLISLITLLQLESLRQPVIVVLEDVQWLDAASIDLLARLERTLTADAAVQYPLAILATARSGEESEVVASLARDRIELGTLDPAGLASLARTRLGGLISDRLSSLIQAHSEGNPFFAEQILRYLQERGLLVPAADGWTISPEYNRSPLPLDVSAVLVARLDRLALEVKEAVQTAAVLGREFEVRLLSYMLQSGAGRTFALPSDEGVRLVIFHAEQEAIWSALDELRYIFRHALLRETAYQMQVQTRRQELHSVAVLALETVYGDEIPLHYAELAYHADHADLGGKARDYSEKAGDAAAQAYQNSQAAEYYTRALALTPQEELGARYGLLVKREQIFDVSGEREKRGADLAELQALCDKLNDPDRLAYTMMRQARYHAAGADFPRAIEAAHQAVDLAAAAQALETTALAHGFAAQALYRSGNYGQAVTEVEAGLEAAHLAMDVAGESMLYNTMGLIYLEQDKTGPARESFSKSLELAQQSQDLRAQSRALTNLGLVAAALSDLPGAQGYYEESLELSRKIGGRSDESVNLANLGWIAGTLGEPAKARTFLETQLRIVHEIGDAWTEAYGWINLSAQSSELGDFEAAIQQAERGLELARKIGDRSGEAWALTYLGRGQQGQGSFSLAEASFRQALSIRQELDQPNLATEPQAGLARVLLGRGNLPEAKDVAEQILAFIKNAGTLSGTDDPLRVYYSCYLVLKDAQDPRSASILETAYSELQARAARIAQAELREAFLRNVESNRLLLEAWQAETRL